MTNITLKQSIHMHKKVVYTRNLYHLAYHLYLTAHLWLYMYIIITMLHF